MRTPRTVGDRGPALPGGDRFAARRLRSEEHTSELQSRLHLVCRLLLEKKKNTDDKPKSRHPADAHKSQITKSNLKSELEQLSCLLLIVAGGELMRRSDDTHQYLVASI